MATSKTTKSTKATAATKTATAKKTTSKKATTNKATTAKKTVEAREPQFVIEYANQRISTDDILKRIKDDLKNKGAKRTAANALDIYVQPENNDVYYVSNAGTVKELSGKIDLI
ncbi:MAG: DUF6465 family protein [Lachnospiraceae bacterium]|nr:DUF6465 family protein [Lachnospiraceae bacterium]